MKTLVTGATGFLGSAVARALLQEGRDVRVLARRDADLANLQGLEVERVEGDLRDPASLRSALAGCETLYHVAAYYSLWDKNKDLIYEINVQGTRNILEAARQAGVGKVVYTSTVGCIGLHADKTPANEDAPFDPATLSNDYKISKYQAEQIALEFNSDSLPVVIVNPSAPVGPRDLKPTPTGKIILDFLNRKMPAYVDTGLNLIDVDDCARGHLLAETRGTPGERYILGNRNMSLREILLALEALTGLSAPSVKMPYWVAHATGMACEWISNYLTHAPPAVPLAGVKMAKYHMYFDPSKAVRELGLPQQPVEQALMRAIEWFRQNNYSKN
ncbi:MAG: NAD-dependent epimerase/dehydratase family protein [Candidatus Nitrohelix vancouverensis]|uniref:NAD-dependent epimerase/dehydratase family protein n=1 Tax=Candidatus Nitrohelix vancouverensis TaxID=2705534 RepID=A0A7T0G372_9BACT|nr:MAG: NAD-dependent epimerase/dehydratase family protein [Candidatus Nitrohelix vancouverensis]